MSTAPPQAPLRGLLLNGMVPLCSRASSIPLLHEGAHAVAGLAQGLTPTLTPFSVDYARAGLVVTAWRPSP